MRTLFITHHYLSSPGGGTFASRAYINAFAELSDEMTLLYPVKEGEDTFEGINTCIKLVPVPYELPKVIKLVRILTGKVHRYFSTAPAYIQSGQFDTIVFDTSIVSYRLIAMAKQCGLRTIVIHHNFQYEYFRDNTHGPMKWITLFWCQRYEKQAVQLADINLTLTETDKESLIKIGGQQTKNSFAVLGTFEYQYTEKKKPQKGNGIKNFVITGDLSGVQTYESLIPWINNLYAELKAVFPDSHLTIAGRNPNSQLLALCQQHNISIIASPPSMEPILEAADCYICPTSLGSGIKLRVLDGLKWGLPVVAHDVSARGYEQMEETGCLLRYSDGPSFRAALTLLREKSIDKEKVLTAYRKIFSLEAGCKRLESILRMP